jgi:phosphoglucosamine mutase
MLPDNTVVTTVMSNFGLYKALDENGIRYEKTKVGDRYVYECMKDKGYLLGGEQSGHVIFRKYAHTGDGMVTALMLMNVMMESHLPLSRLAQGCDMYPQVLKNVEVDDKQLTLECDEVKASVKACEEALSGHGRVLLRASGTEPVLRVMAEAETDEEAEANVDRIIDAMRASGHLLKVR